MAFVWVMVRLFVFVILILYSCYLIPNFFTFLCLSLLVLYMLHLSHYPPFPLPKPYLQYVRPLISIILRSNNIIVLRSLISIILRPLFIIIIFTIHIIMIIIIFIRYPC